MPAPATASDFLGLVRKSNLIETARLDAYLTTHPGDHDSPADLARSLSAAGMLTGFQTEQLLKGKHRGFFLGKYRLLERIGTGGMGQVFLAEHTSMKRRAAVKVLPPEMAVSDYARERFRREARAIGQFDHPNIVRAFDVDSDGEVCFLVMEYIDGISLHDLVGKSGPLDPARAGYYLWQAAVGLAYVHAAGLIHRDIKPANLLVDRAGVVKILDLGLVRSEDDGNELTRGQGVKLLGTADFLAPEQAINCSTVDIRADLYSLGATAYFLLTGRVPYPGDKVSQKLIAHQVKPAPRVDEVRADVPADLCDIVAKMMAKKPEDRFQTPAELAVALERWAQNPPPPPAEHEIPAPVGGAVCPGTITGGRTPRPGQSSGSTSGSGSYVRYGVDSGRMRHGVESSGRLLPLAPLTPMPTVRQPAPSSVAGPAAATIAPPVLPAARTHLLTTDPLADTAGPEVFNPFLKPSSPGMTPVKPKQARRRKWSIVLACAVALGVAAWDAVLIQRVIAKSSQPAANPHPTSGEAASAKRPG